MTGRFRTNDLMRINPKEKGFALIVTLFLVIVLTLTAAGNLLNMERHQRSVQRSVDQVKLAWAADAVIDRTFKLFNDYARANGFPPQEEDASGDWIVYDETGSVVESPSDPFQKKLKSWFAAPFQSPQAGAAARFEGLEDLKLDQVIVRADPATKDDLNKRLYEIKVRLSRAAAGMTSEYSQKIEVSTGKLFDYSVFCNIDLEIASGNDWELQGPVFSNGDVYLMNLPGSTLTLKMPDQATHSEYYALRSAGNIYFYFKTAIAENNLLKNPKYRAAVPPVYKTDESENPLYSAGTKGVEVNASPTLKRDLKYTPPYVYHFLNGATYGGPWAHTIKVKKNGTDYFFLSSGYPSNSWITLYGSLGWYGMIFAPYSFYSASTNNINIAAAIERDPAKARKLLPGWTAAQPKSASPMVNPSWKGLPVGSAPRDAMIGDRTSHNVARKALPVGAGQADPHILIEPLKASDSASVRKYKYETYANIRFDCADEACAGNDYVLKILKEDKTEWHENVLSGGDLSIAGVAFKDFYDYRLKASVRMLEINIPDFLASIRDHTGIDFTKADYRPIIYVQTDALNTWSPGKWAPVVVRLVNGAVLPVGGLSVVTNGRLWVLGDYNIWDYTKSLTCGAESLKDGSCKPPSADLYSDSFGFLGNSYTNEATGGATLEQRLVPDDRILNAAVVTGFLPSQLEKFGPAYINAFESSYAECSKASEDPTVTPCYHYPPNADFSDKDALGRSASARDENGIYFLNRESDYYKNLKQKHLVMSTPGTDYYEFLSKTEKQTYKEAEIRCVREVPAEGPASGYVCGEPSVSKTLEGSVQTYHMPKEYFNDTDPTPIPIYSAVDDSKSLDGIFNGWVSYFDSATNYSGVMDNSVPAARPFPSSSYVGIWFKRLNRGELDKPVHYACIKDRIRTYYIPHAETCKGGTAESGPKVCTWGYGYDTETSTDECKCGNQYTYKKATDPDSKKGTYLHETRDPAGALEKKDFDGHPNWAAPSNYENSGICPEKKDNAFAYFPHLNYTFRAYIPLWEPRYSGGLENMINFQEKWTDTKGSADITDDTLASFHFRGSLIAGWESKRLVKADGSPAFYLWEQATTYYSAPVRDYAFNSDLRTNPPPLPESSGMLLFSIARRGFREEMMQNSGAVSSGAGTKVPDEA